MIAIRGSHWKSNEILDILVFKGESGRRIVGLDYSVDQYGTPFIPLHEAYGARSKLSNLCHLGSRERPIGEDVGPVTRRATYALSTTQASITNAQAR